LTKYAALVATAAAVLAGCGGGTIVVPTGPVKLDELRADSRPYFWVGTSFEGLPLTYAEQYNGRFGSLMYGTCEIRGGSFSDEGCAPPLEIQNTICRGEVSVAIFPGGRRAARAAKALRPLNAAARRAKEPFVSIDRGVACY